MTITLAPETEEKLKEIAMREGRTPDALAESLLAHILEEAELDFQETVAGIERGRLAYAEGRSRSLSEYVADIRRRRQERTATLSQEVKQIAA